MSTLTSQADWARTLVDIALGEAYGLGRREALQVVLEVLDVLDTVVEEQNGAPCDRAVRIQAARVHILARLMAERGEGR